MKQYIGISRDHSGSMRGVAGAAMKDYNDNIDAIRTAADSNDIDTIVTVVKHAGIASITREIVNSSVGKLKPLTSYPTPGGDTPLFDSVGNLIDALQAVPDATEPDVTFLVMAVTDGEDNSSVKWSGTTLGRKIHQLQGTDRWTFVFRVPQGDARRLESLGIPAGNIQEWEQSERGMRESTVMTQSAIGDYYANVRAGVRSTDSFYANLRSVSALTVRQSMNNISGQVKFYPIRTGGQQIKPFVEANAAFYMPGTAFYQLTKPEKAVQSYKLIAIRNKTTGEVYAGQAARGMLNIPLQGTIKLSPGDHGNWDIFIQSMSNNRLLIAGTNLMHWPNAAK